MTISRRTFIKAGAIATAAAGIPLQLDQVASDRTIKPMDHSKATVRISLLGLTAFCFNGKNQCEMGLLIHREHRPSLSIQEIGPDNSPINVRHSIDLDHDLRIEATNAGVAKYLQPGFDRSQDAGDPEDFRWVMDLEGEEFHNQLLTQIGSLGPKLHINDGTVYTRLKSGVAYARKRADTNAEDPSYLGKVANVVGVDIVCDDDGGVLVTNERTNNQLWLRKIVDGRHRRYQITISNTRPEVAFHPGHMNGSDFLLYYQIFRDSAGEQFDLRNVFPENHPLATNVFLKSSLQRRAAAKGASANHPLVTDVFLGNLRLTLDGEPEVCNSVFLGRTQSLRA